MSEIGYEYDSDVLTEDRIDVREPKAYHVVLYNDDYTTMDVLLMIVN